MVVVPAAPLALDCSSISETSSPAAMIDAWLAEASANDGCDTDPELAHDFDISMLNVCAAADYSITVTWTATDACSNSAQATQTIDITVDAGAPTATAPGDVTVECGAEIPPVPAVVFTDDCGTVVVDFSEVQLDSEFDNEYELLRTWIGTDACGNATTITQTITVEDTTPPTITCPPTQMVDANVNCDFVLVDYTSAAVVSDNCDIAGVTQSPAPGVIITTGTTTVTLVVTDDAGNSTECMFDVIANDSTDPVALCLDIEIALDASGMATITPADIDNGSFDNCTEQAMLTLAASQTEFTCMDLGMNVVTLTVTDMAGNVSTCDANVVVTGDIVVPIENATLTECPNVPEQDVATFDLTTAMVDVNGGNTVTYYNSLLGAQNAVASDEITNPTAFDSQTKTVYARVENAGGCFNVASIWLITNDSPDPDPLPWFKFCEADLPLPIDGNPVGGSGVYVTHVWGGPDVAILDPATTDTSTPLVLAGTEPGIYKVDYMVTDDAGCVSELTFINIEIYPSPIIEACTSTPTVCIGDAINLSSTTVDGTPPYTFEWTEPVTGYTSTSENATITSSNAAYPTVAGLYTYTVVVTDDNGCTDMSSVDIQFNEAPIAIPSADVTNSFFCSSNKGMGSSPVKGNTYSTSVLSADLTNACANVTLGGGPLCTGTAAPMSSARWYENATGGSPLLDADTNADGINDADKDGDSTTFDPIAAGLVDPNAPGVYTYYVEAVCANTSFCTSPTRTAVTLTVLDCDILDGCTYLLVLEDTGSDGWDGASIDVVVDQNPPGTNYKLTTTDCDLLLIPISAGDGQFIDLQYWDGAKNEEHTFFLLDPLGNIAVDINGNPVNYGPSPISDKITVQLDCPTDCEETVDYFVVNTIGSSPANQVWELRDQTGEIVASNAFEDYDGLAQGSQVIDTVQLTSCDNYTFTTFAPNSSVWQNANWQIIGSDKDRGTVISGGTFDGLYEIATKPTPTFVGDQISAFNIPCKPDDCPADIIEVTTDIANCELSGYVHPAPATPFICYPNCNPHLPSPVTTISYPGLGEFGLAVDAAVDLPVGTNEVIFEITYGDGQLVRCTSNVLVVTDTNPTIVCNDHLNVPLSNINHLTPDDCFRTITPDELIENPLACEGQYNVIIFDTEGQRLSPPNVVGPDQVGLLLTYKVEHIGSGVSCHGTLTVEDKNAPIIECTDYDIACNNPNVMDENYSHVENYSATGLPANLSGATGSSVDVDIEVECTAIGEVIQNVSLIIDNNHSRTSDLQVTLTSPSGQTVTSGLPVNPSAFDGELFSSAAGTWSVSIVDTNGASIGGDAGGQGSIFGVELEITAGFRMPVLVLDCSDVSFSVIGEFLEDTNCTGGDIGSVLVRTWEAVDAQGNSSTCEQRIGLIAPTIADLDLPEDAIFECGDVPNDPAQITAELAGAVAFDCAGINPDQNNLCDILITFEDDVLEKCGTTFIITRTWTILNWCSGVPTTHIQKIIVSDTKGPEINTANIQYGAGSNQCVTGNVFLSPAVIDQCGSVTSIIATYRAGGGMFDDPGTLTIVDITNGASISDLPLGMSQVMVTAVDNCGNSSETLVDVNVADNLEPTAICDDNLNITLSSDGTGVLLATDLDEGSTDNCGIASIQARRVSGCITTDWSDSIPFECCDIDEMITVELLVTDLSGNTNTCWSEVLIEDAVAPVIDCAENVTINCDEALTASDMFMDPTASDVCGATIEAGDIITVDLPNCGQLLTRTYTASDDSDKSDDASCTQTVTIVHVSDFIVQFPADLEFDDCELGDIPGVSISEDDCENIGISVEDRIFTQVDDACYKIERTYTVINHCIVDDPSADGLTALGTPLPVPNTFRDDDGYFQYTQVIKVLDTEAPTLTFTAPDPCDFTDGCEGELELIASAEDNCADITSVELSYEIDAFGDGTFDIEGNGNDASGIYPYGDHIIRWIATDGCGNVTAEDFAFSVRDCKNPTPVCQGITTVVMNNGECVSIWALDLLEYAEDNCTERTTEEWEDNARIRRAGETGALTTALDVCCDDVQNGGVEVEVWIEDEAGNADFCIVLVEIQDNGGNCPDAGAGASARISGTTATEFNTMVNEVQVNINDDMVMTNAQGIYTTLEQVDNMYEVTPSKLDGVVEGISTFDLVLLAQHILDIKKLGSPYQLIAADINGDNTVDIFDMVELRQLILYYVDNFSNNTSWRFVDADYAFQNPTAPWFEDYPQSIMVELGTTSMLNEDFIAVKIGDLDGDAKANLTSLVEQRSGPSPLQIQIDNAEVKAGNEVKVDFRANDFNKITGYQFTLDFDQTALDFVSVDAGVLDVNESNFGMKMTNLGILTTSFAEMGKAISTDDDEILFSIKFNVKADGVLEDLLSISDDYLNAEAYNVEGKFADVQLTFSNEELLVTDTQFELFQNAPNPFNAKTVIGFNLPERAEASMIVYDLTGKVIFSITDTYARGYNEVEFDRQQFKSAGTFIYQFSSAKYTAERKIIVID